MARRTRPREVVEAELVEQPTALASPPGRPPARRRSVRALLDAALGTLAQTTRKAYQQDLRAFGKWWGSADPLAELIAFDDPGEARELVMRYQAHLKQEAKVSAATIARRMRTLNSLVNKLNFAGYVDWELNVPVVKVEALKDVRGPGKAKWKKLIRVLERDDRWFGCRDLAMVRLMGNDNLRAGELGLLRIQEDIRVVEGGMEVYIHGKGQKNLWHPVHPKTRQALEEWIELRETRLLERGIDPFSIPWVFLSQRHKALSGKRIWERVMQRAEEAGMGKLHPHALRHFAITQKAKSWNGPQSALTRWARHSDANMTQRYVDDVKDEVYKISQLGE